MPSPSAPQVWQPDPGSLSGAYRLCRFFLAEEEIIMDVIREAFHSLCGKPEVLEHNRCRILFFQRLWRILQKQKHSADHIGSPELEALRTLPNPQRAAALFFYLTPLEVDETSRVLGVNPPALAAQLLDARRELALAFGQQGHFPSAAADFVRSTSGDSNSLFYEVDGRVFAAVEELKPSVESISALEALAAEFSAHRFVKFRLRDPAFLAILLAAALCLGVVIWLFWAERPSFNGEDRLASLLQGNVQISAGDYDPIEVYLPDLDDWLALNGVDHFWVPSELVAAKTSAARTFTFDNVRVGAAALPELNMMAFFLDAKEAKIELYPERVWHLFQAGPDAGAAIRNGRAICLVAIRGDIPTLRKILAELAMSSSTNP